MVNRTMAEGRRRKVPGREAKKKNKIQPGSAGKNI